MRQNIHKTVIGLLKSKVLLTISASFMLSSCVIYTGGYSETDGVYYDPNRDTLPQAQVNNYGNAVGDYYDYGYQREGVIENSRRNERDRQNRYRNDNWSNGNTSNSDWGVYSGSEVNYYDYGWGNSFWGSPWGMGFGYGWGSPWWNLGYSSRFGWGMSIGYGWGSPWGWYDPFWGFYGSRWGMYNPYWGWGGYYGAGYWGARYYTVPRRLSGADGAYYNNSMSARNSTAQGSLRTGNTYRAPGLQQSTGVNNRIGNQRIGTSSSTNSTMRNNTYQNNSVYQQNSSSYGSPSMRSNSSGGMRSGGFSGSSSSGGMRTSSGGMRTR